MSWGKRQFFVKHTSLYGRLFRLDMRLRRVVYGSGAAPCLHRYHQNRRLTQNGRMIATLATFLSLQVTITSGYMLSRLRGKMANTWFGLICLFPGHPIHRLDLAGVCGFALGAIAFPRVVVRSGMRRQRTPC